MKKIYKDILDEVNNTSNPTTIRNRNDRVLLIDGLNTFIRAWTVTPTMNENGDHIGGITGFLNSIGYAIRELNPTRVIIVFDGKGNSNRKKQDYDGYKANRKKSRFRVNRAYPEMMNEEEEHKSMARQLFWLIDCLDYTPVTTMIYEGIEADDVMAYISRQILVNGEESIIMSTDKDFLQLINETTLVWSPTKKLLYNTNKLYEEYKLYPKNMLLYRILDGDKSDNIPGIKGVGLKTLIKRIPQISEDIKMDIDEIIKIAENQKDDYKIFEKIAEAKDTLIMNKKLMQLEDPDIGTKNKLMIREKFDENIKNKSKFEFFKVMNNYKMLQTFTNANDWFRELSTRMVI